MTAFLGKVISLEEEEGPPSSMSVSEILWRMLILGEAVVVEKKCWK